MFSEIFTDEVPLSHNSLSSGKAKTYVHITRTHTYIEQIGKVVNF